MAKNKIEPYPCPFCGREKPEVWKRDDGWAVKCVWGCSIVIDGYVSRGAAIKAWNNRPDKEKNSLFWWQFWKNYAGQAAKMALNDNEQMYRNTGKNGLSYETREFLRNVLKSAQQAHGADLTTSPQSEVVEPEKQN